MAKLEASQAQLDLPVSQDLKGIPALMVFQAPLEALALLVTLEPPVTVVPLVLLAPLVPLVNRDQRVIEVLTGNQGNQDLQGLPELLACQVLLVNLAPKVVRVPLGDLAIQAKKVMLVLLAFLAKKVTLGKTV